MCYHIKFKHKKYHIQPSWNYLKLLLMQYKKFVVTNDQLRDSLISLFIIWNGLNVVGTWGIPDCRRVDDPLDAVLRPLPFANWMTTLYRHKLRLLSFMDLAVCYIAWCWCVTTYVFDHFALRCCVFLHLRKSARDSLFFFFFE